jgi:hypothetical protein
MIEFLQNYGLWIVLAGVFIAMHRFGMGCCGGGHRHGPTRRPEGLPSGGPKDEREPEATTKSKGSCH